jgi:hypothetical protein
MHPLRGRAGGTPCAEPHGDYPLADFHRPRHRVPAGTNYVAVAAGGFHSLALTADGAVRAWGRNDQGQCNVPADGPFVAIAAGEHHSLAIAEDGTLRAWGQNTYGQCNAPAGGGFVAVAAGVYHSLAIAGDGSLRAWGRNDYGECTVPAGNDYVAVAAGERFSVARTADGTLVIWGRNDYGQCNTPEGMAYGDAAAGWFHTVALIAGASAPENHAPVAYDQSVEADEDTPLAIALQATDEDGDDLVHELLTLPAHGVLTGTPPDLTYHPDANYHGPDGFSFQVSDGQATSNAATVSIVVNPVNDRPVAVATVNGQASVILEEESWLGTTVTLDATESHDPDGDLLACEWDFTGDGAADASGPVTEATYPVGGPYTAVLRVTDAAGETATATVEITIVAGSVANQLDNVYDMVLDGVLSGGVAQQLQSSLLSKLDAVAACLNSGKPNAAKTAANNLNALMNHLDAQAGKKIDAALASEMIQRLRLLADQLQP